MKKKKKFFYGWVVVIGCVIMMAFIVPPMSTINSTLTDYVEKGLSISRVLFNARVLVMSVVGVAISPWAGKFLSRCNLKVVWPIAITVLGASYAANYFVTNIYVYYAIALFTGVAFILGGMLPVTIVINRWFVEKRGLAMSLAMGGIGIGSFILSPITAAVLKNFNWNAAYLAMGLLVLVVALPICVFLVKADPAEMGLEALGKQDMEAVNEGKKIEKTQLQGDLQKRVSIPFKEASKKMFFWMLLIGILAIGLFAGGSVSQMSTAVLQRFGENAQTKMVMIFSIVGIFGKLIQGWVGDRFGIIANCIYGIGTTFMGILLYFISPTAFIVYIGAAFYGLGTGVSSLSAPIITGSMFSGKDYGAAYGYVSAVQSAGQALGMILLSAVYDSAKKALDATGVAYDPEQPYIGIYIILLILLIVALVTWLISIKGSKKYSN